jgi:hypothetical protein
MTKEFVPYELAFKLIYELGFKEKCLATIDQSGYLHIKGTKSSPRGSMLYDIVDCPTLSQAFRWFRENYSLYSLIGMHPNTKEWYSSYQNLNWSGKETLDFIKTEDRRIRFKTYEEAELATLDKLIEIVETKQQEQ